MEENKVCCPKIEPSRWENKEHIWKAKLFVRDYITQIFHIPLNFGSVITRLDKGVREGDSQPKLEDFLTLAYDPSPWKSELYMSVTKAVPGMENVKLSGTYITKVFDGPFNNVPNWIKEFDEYLEGKNMNVLKYYFYYTTCPKCAKKYGHNYVIIFAQVRE